MIMAFPYSDKVGETCQDGPYICSWIANIRPIKCYRWRPIGWRWSCTSYYRWCLGSSCSRHANYQNRCYWCFFVNQWWVDPNIHNRLRCFFSCDSMLRVFYHIWCMDLCQILPWYWWYWHIQLCLYNGQELVLKDVIRMYLALRKVCYLWDRWIYIVTPHYSVVDCGNLRKDLWLLWRVAKRALSIVCNAKLYLEGFLLLLYLALV